MLTHEMDLDSSFLTSRQERKKYIGWDREVFYLLTRKKSHHTSVQFVYKLGAGDIFAVFPTKIETNTGI